MGSNKQYLLCTECQYKKEPKCENVCEKFTEVIA